MLKQNKCLGCGAIKQTDNIDKVGYVKDLNHDYCFECFNLKNYGKVINHFHPPQYDNIKSGSLVLIISSVFHLDQLFHQPITKIQPNAKYTYVINQIDLLPKDTNINYLNNQIQKLFKKHRVIYEDIIYMSALNSNDISNLKNYLNDRLEKEIYLFGYQNSGKTTILKGLTNNDNILAINKAGLTQEIILDQFNDKTLYDMPGTYTKGFLADYFSYETYKKMLPYKTIKPKIYQLKNTNKLVVNNIIEIKIIGTEKTSLVFYMRDNIEVMKYNLNNTNNYLLEEFEYTKKIFKIENKKQITIADFIMLYVSGTYSIEIKYPKNMKLTIMESLLK